MGGSSQKLGLFGIINIFQYQSNKDILTYCESSKGSFGDTFICVCTCFRGTTIIIFELITIHMHAPTYYQTQVNLTKFCSCLMCNGIWPAGRVFCESSLDWSNSMFSSSLGGGTCTTTGLVESVSLLTSSTYIGPVWLFRCI